MSHDTTFRTERTLPFSPQAVYNAFASAEMLATWWGPEGFTNEFETFEFQVGGRWKFVMVGSDGSRYPNQCVFTELESESRVGCKCLMMRTSLKQSKRLLSQPMSKISIGLSER